MIRKRHRLAAILVLSSGPLLAQMLGTYAPGGLYQDRCVIDTPVALTGDGVCPEPPYPMPPRVAAGFPAGAVTANHPGGLILATDGVTDIIRRFHPKTDCPGAPATLPPLPLPAGYGPANPVTGMTMDPASLTLYLTDGNVLTAHDPAAGMAMTGGPWAIPVLNLVTGLDYDSCTGVIVAVDSLGGVGAFGFGGAALINLSYVPWPHPGVLAAGALATGVAIDRCVAHPCAGVPPATYVSWTSGQVIQAATGFVVPGGPAPMASVGLTYTAVPIRLASPASCSATPLPARSSYVRAGSAATFKVCNVPGGVPNAHLAVSLGFLAGGGLVIPPCGERLWVDPALFPFPPLPVPVVGGTASTTTGPLPFGVRAYLQWAITHPVTGALELSDANQIEVGN